MGVFQIQQGDSHEKTLPCRQGSDPRVIARAELDCAALGARGNGKPVVSISNEARIWAVRQLARRAGVTHEFFDSWKIDVQPAATVIHVQRGTEKQICFRNLSLQKEDNLAGLNFHTVRAGWMGCPGEPIRSAIPDLIVPFCEQAQNGGRPPLFRQASADRIECFADLPASTIFSLCRVEETQQRRRDNCSRFSAKMSVAARDGFVDRPIVDEWGLALGQALEALVPGWHPKERRLRSKISHDIDEVGSGKRLWPDHLNGDSGSLARTAWMALPFDLRRAIQLCLADHRPIAGGAHLLRTLVLGPSCLDLIDYLASQDQLRGLRPAIYWKASHLGPYDSGYDLRHKKIRDLIYRLGEQGVEHGVHPGYGTYLRQTVLEAELRILRDVLQERQLGGRQHYLRWCPETWMDWENAGLCYDSSVGYADQAGFRAGTCIPYRPWQLSWNREARLLEIPLIVMDVTLLNYMMLRGDALLDSVRQLIERCRLVGGVFTFLCHNTTLRDSSFAGAYGQILDMLASTAQFDWKSNLANEWC